MIGSITFALLLLFLALILRWRWQQITVFQKMGVPGPKPNIIFGNMFEMYKKVNGSYSPRKLDSFPSRITTKTFTIGRFYFGFRPVMMITDPELLKMIQIKDFQEFIDRPQIFANSLSPIFMNQLVHLKGKRWKEVRSILTPSFTTGRMKQMAPMMNDAICTVMAKIEEISKTGEEFDIYNLYQRLTMDVIGRAAFGLETDVQHNQDNPFLKMSKIVFSGHFSSKLVLLGLSLPEITNLVVYLRRVYMVVINKGRNPAFDMIDACAEVIKARRQDPSKRHPDLLQLMIDAEMRQEDMQKVTGQHLTAGEDDEKDLDVKEPINYNGTKNEPSKLAKHMNDDEVKANAMMFFLAGYETTSCLLAFSTYFLAMHPQVQEKVRAEVDDLLEREGELDYGSVHKLRYLDQVISESLRLYPPIYMFINRESNTDIRYGNVFIPKKMAIQIPIILIHHDPEFWPDPEKFDPDRFSPENKSKIQPMTYQPFGAGPRNCIGLRFAQMETKLALSHVLHDYILLPSSEYATKPLEVRYGPATVTPLKGVYVKAIKRIVEEK